MNKPSNTCYVFQLNEWINECVIPLKGKSICRNSRENLFPIITTQSDVLPSDICIAFFFFLHKTKLLNSEWAPEVFFMSGELRWLKCLWVLSSFIKVSVLFCLFILLKCGSFTHHIHQLRDLQSEAYRDGVVSMLDGPHPLLVTFEEVSQQGVLHLSQRHKVFRGWTRRHNNTGRMWKVLLGQICDWELNLLNN